jgi:uncharacterized RDD family membrane protein YckC
MACPRCGDRCLCTPPASQASGSVSVLIDPDAIEFTEQAFAASLDAPAEAPTEELSAWKQEVQSRLKAHRARRGRDVSDESMSFGFAEPPRTEPRRRAQALARSLQVQRSDWEAAPAPAATQEAQAEPEPQPAPAPMPLARFPRVRVSEPAKVIEFPAPTNLDLFHDELADPVSRAPRILEAAEPQQEVAVGPQFPTIHLEQQPVAESLDDASFEIPLNPAPISARALALAIDSGIALTGAAIFAMLVAIITDFNPQGKQQLICIGGLLALCWAAYHYLFFVYGGATPGMNTAQLEFADFERNFPSHQARASRAASLLLSCLSLGLGFAWALVDEDSLCWHDRISQTYLKQSD